METSSRVSIFKRYSALFDRAQGGQEQGQGGDGQYQGQREGQNGLDPSGERQARCKPDNHFRIAIRTRQGQQHRNEQGERKQHRKIIQRVESEQRNHRRGSQLAARRLTEQTDQLGRQENCEQRNKDGYRGLRKLAQRGALEDHRPFDFC
jgi:hypothetical protein